MKTIEEINNLQEDLYNLEAEEIYLDDQMFSLRSRQRKIEDQIWAIKAQLKA